MSEGTDGAQGKCSSTATQQHLLTHHVFTLLSPWPHAGWVQCSVELRPQPVCVGLLSGQPQHQSEGAGPQGEWEMLTSAEKDHLPPTIFPSFHYPTFSFTLSLCLSLPLSFLLFLSLSSSLPPFLSLPLSLSLPSSQFLFSSLPPPLSPTLPS